MTSRVRTLRISGNRGSLVSVEAKISQGLLSFDASGLPDAAVKEVRERTQAAALGNGLHFPNIHRDSFEWVETNLRHNAQNAK